MVMFNRLDFTKQSSREKNLVTELIELLIAGSSPSFLRKVECLVYRIKANQKRLVAGLNKSLIGN